MRNIYALAVVLVLFGGLAFGMFTRNDGVDLEAAQVANAQVKTHKNENTYKTTILANGTIVHELDTGTDSLADIAPAAGGAETQTFYDPLTQTHRRVTTDAQGNETLELVPSE